MEEKTSTPNIEKQTPFSPSIIIAVVITVFAGTVLGFAASRMTQKNGLSAVSRTLGDAASSASYGQRNKELFPDIVTGKLKKGGIESEGTHHLERKGGVSQNVYLTSSSVDLDQFINKTVMVEGKTYSAEKAGWFMEVGYLEIK